MSDIADNIRIAMERSDMSQSRLAAEAQTTGATISRYVNGVHIPSICILKNIADALHVSIDYLLGETEIPDRLTERDEACRLFVRCFDRATPKDKAIIMTVLSEYAKNNEKDMLRRLVEGRV